MKSLTNPSFIRSLRQFQCTSIICLARLMPQIISPTIYIYAQIQICTYIHIYNDVKQSNRQVYFARMRTNDAWMDSSYK